MISTVPRAQEGTTVIAGVDTHKSTHHVAVLDLNGVVLADRQFPTTTSGYQEALDFIAEHGIIDRVGIELTGSYGAGLTRHLIAAGITVLEVNTVDKTTRARRGKDDRIDAIAAGKKVLSGDATATPKDTTEAIESIRMITVVRNSAVRERTVALNQIKDLLVTAPAALREQIGEQSLRTVAAHAARFRPDNRHLADPTQATKRALKRLADRITHLDAEITAAEKDLDALVAMAAPTLVQGLGIGTHTAAQLLVSAGSNIDRIRSEAAFARLCGAAPIPISSGKTNRVRLHRGGDRQANKALHLIAICRLRHDPTTRAYMTRRQAQGLSKKDVLRCLKRAIAREVFRHLKTDLNTT